eukprot:4969385-Pleurochrysis_carterae.AAC.1
MLCWRSFVWRLFTGNLDYGISPVSLITRLEPDGLVALAEALKANTSLTTLKLRGACCVSSSIHKGGPQTKRAHDDERRSTTLMMTRGPHHSGPAKGRCF